MRAVEDGDLALGRLMRVNPPQKVMRQLDRRRLLEVRHLHALRIDAADHMPDRAVLARRIEPLQHNEHGALIFGVELVLQLVQPRDVPLGLRRGAVVVLVFSGVGRIEARQLELGIGLDEIALLETHGTDSGPGCEGVTIPYRRKFGNSYRWLRKWRFPSRSDTTISCRSKTSTDTGRVSPSSSTSRLPV